MARSVRSQSSKAQSRIAPDVAPAPRRGPRPRVDRVARRAEYLRAAASVLLANGPQASMQEIADRAGAPKPVFYRIFASRAALIDALFQHVHDVIIETQKGDWDGYGWALRVLYLEAKKDREIFLVVLKTLRGDPALEAWRQRLLALIYDQAMGFFRPEPGAPPGATRRAVRAGRSLNTLSFDTLVTWLEGEDGLDDTARFRWWGRIVREWRKATREAYQLDPPGQPAGEYKP